MWRTIRTLRQFLRVLCEIQRSAWIDQELKWKVTNEALSTFSWLRSPWRPIREKEINTLFADSDELKVSFPKRAVLYLPPLEREAEFLPVLSLCCDLSEAKTEVKARVMLIRGFQGLKPYGVGFRLETPHGQGRHDYYHAQPVRDLGWAPAIECPSWLPVKEPSFPLLARSPVALMLCLMLSLYGLKYCWEFVSQYQVWNLEEAMRQLDDCIARSRT